MKSKYNSTPLGMFLGVLLPVIAFFIFYFFNTDRFGSFETFINRVFFMNVLTKIISLCAIPNLLLFFIFMWKHLYKSARGVIAATFVITFIVLIIKFL